MLGKPHHESLPSLKHTRNLNEMMHGVLRDPVLRSVYAERRRWR
jgi:hypothetical protein